MADIGSLFAAAEKGDAASVKELGALAEGCDPKATEAIRSLAFDGNLLPSMK